MYTLEGLIIPRDDRIFYLADQFRRFRYKESTFGRLTFPNVDP